MARKPKSPPAPTKALPKPKAKAKPMPAVSPVKKKPNPRSKARTDRTIRARETFLAHFEKTCNVAEAARIAGVGRRTVYDWRDADPAFADAWDDAEQAAADRLEAKAFDLAESGKSERMLEILLKAHRPKYREKQRHEFTGANGGPIEYAKLPLEEIQARIRAQEEALKLEGPKHG